MSKKKLILFSITTFILLALVAFLLLGLFSANFAFPTWTISYIMLLVALVIPMPLFLLKNKLGLPGIVILCLLFVGLVVLNAFGLATFKDADFKLYAIINGAFVATALIASLIAIACSPNE